MYYTNIISAVCWDDTMNCLELSEKTESDISIFELFNEMNDGIVIQEINGKFVWANEAMGEIIGIPHSMIVGMDAVDFFSVYFSPLQQNQKVFINLLKIRINII